jgi:hypothetical protein
VIPVVLTHHAQVALGPIVGALGILIGVVAHRRAARAVAECSALIDGSVGSRGTVDPRALRDLAVVRYDALSEMSGQEEHAVRAARLGQALPAATHPADNGVTVKTRPSMPAA